MGSIGARHVGGQLVRRVRAGGDDADDAGGLEAVEDRAVLRVRDLLGGLDDRGQLRIRRAARDRIELGDTVIMVEVAGDVC